MAEWRLSKGLPFPWRRGLAPAGSWFSVCGVKSKYGSVGQTNDFWWLDHSEMYQKGSGHTWLHVCTFERCFLARLEEMLRREALRRTGVGSLGFCVSIILVGESSCHFNFKGRVGLLFG